MVNCLLKMFFGEPKIVLISWHSCEQQQQQKHLGFIFIAKLFLLVFIIDPFLYCVHIFNFSEVYSKVLHEIVSNKCNIIIFVKYFMLY